VSHRSLARARRPSRRSRSASSVSRYAWSAGLETPSSARCSSHLLELGELYQANGRPALAADQYRILAATVRLLRDSGVSTDLEIARYLADHGSARAAVGAARSAWRQAPSIWSADALGWALHAAGHDRQALARSRTATRLGTPDAILWLHRGSIEAALGRDVAAMAHLRAGLDHDPGLNAWQAARARALLGQLAGSR